ncbi:hypothetical protein [Nonomuraea sp. SYSU D8015]|uniref:hypothetical protein n=1 Tax=Nonomuraea sp. SYSU D8015 TaxID=2593644 RepID=UPI0016603A0B|nr:hypothetical protein [Nonomuraea sp. SYSU D8015]
MKELIVLRFDGRDGTTSIMDFHKAAEGERAIADAARAAERSLARGSFDEFTVVHYSVIASFPEM